jgi:glycosyltransferase involved in cell wall biosynthesis
VRCGCPTLESVFGSRTVIEASDAPGRRSGPRTLALGGRTRLPAAELRRLIDADATPDSLSTDEAIGALYVDARYLDAVPGLSGAVLRRLPFRCAQAAAARLHGAQFDAVLSWSDLPTVLAGSAMRGWRQRPAHVAIMMWPSKPKKRLPLRLTLSRIDRIVVPSPRQRTFLAEEMGVSKERFVDVQWPVDTQFWRPLERDPAALICSAGQEMRDYATLVEALRGLNDVPCHIAAGGGAQGTTDESWWRDVRDRPLPDNVTIGPKSYEDLRELYARSRFVVVPLRPSDHDNGTTAIREALAMGKAVICTDIAGHPGELEDGVNCVRVPPCDPEALRGAIRRLWDDPDLCRRLGAAGRRLVVERHGIDQWTKGVEGAVADAVAARTRPISRARRPFARRPRQEHGT